MARDVVTMLRTCRRCRQQAKGGARSIRDRALPKGWAGELIAADPFGPLLISRKGSSLILVVVDRVSRWVGFTALEQGGSNRDC